MIRSSKLEVQSSMLMIETLSPELWTFNLELYVLHKMRR